MASTWQFLKSAKMNNYCSTLSSELMSSLGYSLRGSGYILNSIQEVIRFIGSKQPSCAAVYRPVFSFMFTLLLSFRPKSRSRCQILIYKRYTLNLSCILAHERHIRFSRVWIMSGSILFRSFKTVHNCKAISLYTFSK